MQAGGLIEPGGVGKNYKIQSGEALISTEIGRASNKSGSARG
jgi:hypothetical protein